MVELDGQIQSRKIGRKGIITGSELTTQNWRGESLLREEIGSNHKSQGRCHDGLMNQRDEREDNDSVDGSCVLLESLLTFWWSAEIRICAELCKRLFPMLIPNAVIG